MALRRITKELDHFERTQRSQNVYELIHVEPIGDDLYHFSGYILVTNNCPFMNGKYLLDIKYPQNYPFKPPKIKFITKMYHPNISKDGMIDLSILKHNWSPSLSITQTLLTISALLNEPIIRKYDWRFANKECIKLYTENRLLYESKTNEYAVKYANATKQYNLKDEYIAIKQCLCNGFGEHFSFILEPFIIEYIGFNIKKLNKWCTKFKLQNDKRYTKLLRANSFRKAYTREKISLCCRLLTEADLCITIWNDLTVSDLKQEIYNSQGIFVEQFRIVFKGNVLHNEQRLYDCNLKNKSVIHVILRYE
eukprot:323217_1